MKRKILRSFLAFTLVTGLLAGCGAPPEPPEPSPTPTPEITAAPTEVAEVTTPPPIAEEPVLNIYSSRDYESDQILYDNFTAETGIKVNVVAGKAGELMEKLKIEGESTEADIFITVDGGVLNTAKEEDLLQPIVSEKVNANVPENFRDSENYWAAISSRARVIAYSKERVDPAELSTYEDLTSEKWNGKVLARSSTSLYNQSLLSSFITLNGEEMAKEWAAGIVNNFAREPEGNDRDQIKAIAAGVGDVALVNSYYYGLLLNSEDPEEVKVAEQTGIFFPNQETNGTHVNISGIGVTKHAKHPQNATMFVEYMTDVEQQEFISANNFEFPVNPNAKLPELLASWGPFKAQDIDLSTLGDNNARAIEIFTEVGWK